MVRPSGDQNGAEAFSVPFTATPSRALKGRIHSLTAPVWSIAEKASRVPSGETTTGPAPNPTARYRVSGGGGINASTGAASAAWGRCTIIHIAKESKNTASTPATIQA